MRATMRAISPNCRQKEVRIPCEGAVLSGDVEIPHGAVGLVIFAHGSGSSRMSSRNRLVAGELNHKGLATLLFDLLTPEEAEAEAETGVLRFDIPFLTSRLVAATRWAQADACLGNLGIGYFGSSTGAAAALVAAADIPEVQAVVSRGGRTDLAMGAIHRVKAPTLLIVGALDQQVLRLNEETYEALTSLKRLARVEGATHLFEESGALEQVAELASAWFELHLTTIGKETI